MTASRPVPVCVLGAGLIGGSLLRAAAAAGWETFGYNRSEIAARADGFDVGTELPAVLRRAAAADALVVLAVPMPALDAVLAQVAAHAPGCALTDVVSVKAPVAAAVRAHGLAARFVGGHPMAGTAESGWAAADAALFRGAAWAVTVDDGTDPAVWRRVARLALDCGSRVVPVTAAEHDAAVARISHLPHVLAEALAQAGAEGGALALGLAAGSFRDGTRVAGTAPDLVRAICEPNAEALRAVLDETLEVLTAARRALDGGSLAALAEAGHAARRRYQDQRPETIAGIVPGAPGWLETLRTAGRRGAVITAID